MTTGTVDLCQNVWSDGETVQLRLKFANDQELIAFLAATTGTTQLQYKGLVPPGAQYNWSLHHNIKVDHVKWTVVAVFDANKVQVSRVTTKEALPKDDRGTGTGTVVYTDALSTSHQVDSAGKVNFTEL